MSGTLHKARIAKVWVRLEALGSSRDAMTATYSMIAGQHFLAVQTGFAGRVLSAVDICGCGGGPTRRRPIDNSVTNTAKDKTSESLVTPAPRRSPGDRDE